MNCPCPTHSTHESEVVYGIMSKSKSPTKKELRVAPRLRRFRTGHSGPPGRGPDPLPKTHEDQRDGRMEEGRSGIEGCSSPEGK
jgi:hypothetical protein